MTGCQQPFIDSFVEFELIFVLVLDAFSCSSGDEDEMLGDR